jgi:hypothetical protein
MTPDQRKKAIRYGGPILLFGIFTIFAGFIYALVLIAQAIITVGR